VDGGGRRKRVVAGRKNATAANRAIRNMKKQQMRRHKANPKVAQRRYSQLRRIDVTKPLLSSRFLKILHGCVLKKPNSSLSSKAEMSVTAAAFE
jgi:hypothetical protein